MKKSLQALQSWQNLNKHWGYNMAVTLNGTTGLVFNDGSSQNTAATGFGFKNRIINGAMVIDQRNAGAVQTSPASNTYGLDRWKVNVGGGGFNIQQNAGAVTPPAGFSFYYGVTSTSTTTASNFSVRQLIEGFNFADFGFGTANAQSVTLSFWVRSSLTGTFGGAIQNDVGTRSYVFSYTISSANTWQQVTATVPGDTSGTWIGATTGAGAVLYISYSAAAAYAGAAGSWTANDYRTVTGQTNVLGTNGATFYVTGVQLEKGSTATSFDYRPYGTELQLCQRYYEKSYNMASIAGASTNTNKGSFVTATGNVFWRWTQNYRVSKRADSTFTIYSTTGALGSVRLNNGSDLAVSTEDAGENATAVFVSRNATVGDFFWWQWTASAEL